MIAMIKQESKFNMVFVLNVTDIFLIDDRLLKKYDFFVN